MEKVVYISQNKRNSFRNALSIDVEEWYQTELFNKETSYSSKITNLVKNIHKILLILDKYNVKATFFIVGSVAKKYPRTIKTISEKGHEIASHGYDHRLVYKMSRQEFKKDTNLSLEILRDITQAKIMGYRAPTWSITSNMHWAIDILQSLGLKYDSSIYPLSFNLLRSMKMKKSCYNIKRDFIEFSPSVFRFLGYNFPFSGGTFLRLFPFRFIKNRIAQINNEGHLAMVYLHPWDFGDNCSQADLPKWKYTVQYGNSKTVKAKLELLLQNFRFSSISDILKIDKND